MDDLIPRARYQLSAHERFQLLVAEAIDKDVKIPDELPVHDEAHLKMACHLLGFLIGLR